MGAAPTGWQTPKTNWAPADIPLPADFNRMEGNAYAIEQGSRTIDPSQSPTGNTGALRQLLDWFANRIKAITGTTNWYDAPATTLAAANSHMNATSGVHGVGASTVESAAGAQAKANAAEANAKAYADAHIGQNITSTNAVHGIRQGEGNGFDADKLDGKHWVLIASGSIAVSSGSGAGIPLRPGGAHKRYLASVYANGPPVYIGPYGLAGACSATIVRVASASVVDRLELQNQTTASVTFYYSVWAWE